MIEISLLVSLIGSLATFFPSLRPFLLSMRRETRIGLVLNDNEPSLLNLSFDK